MQHPSSFPLSLFTSHPSFFRLRYDISIALLPFYPILKPQMRYMKRTFEIYTPLLLSLSSPASALRYSFTKFCIPVIGACIAVEGCLDAEGQCVRWLHRGQLYHSRDQGAPILNAIYDIHRALFGSRVKIERYKESVGSGAKSLYWRQRSHAVVTEYKQ
jgi:hypothetical protein